MREILFSTVLLVSMIASVGAQESSLPTDATNTLSMSLRECVVAALENNLMVRAEGYIPLSDGADIQIERSAFDPIWGVEADLTGYTHRERILWMPTGAQMNKDRTDQYITYLSERFPTGTELSLNAWNQKTQNQLYRPNPEYYGKLGLQVTQPLLKGFGPASNMVRLRIAQKSREISSRGFERTMMTVAHDVETAYWDLALAKRDFEIKGKSFQLAEDLLLWNQKRADVGMLPSYELLETQSQVAMRKEHLLRSENAVEDVVDRLKILMNLNAPECATSEVSILPIDDVACAPIQPSVTESVQVALARRPDLSQSDLLIEKTKLSVAFARNQSLPELNFVSGIGLYGFDMNWNRMYDDLGDKDTHDWSVGLVFQVPIGNGQGRYQVKKALLQKERAETQRKALLQQIQMSIRESVRQIETDQGRIQAAQSARDFAAKRLEVEQSLYEQGMSTTHNMLDYQEDLAVAQLEELRALVDCRKALAQLRYVEGTVLDGFGIDRPDGYLPEPIN